MERLLYDLIGVDYNSTRRADPFLTERFFSLMSPRKDSNCLDAGCGTGNYTAALASRGGAFYGVEPSEIMLATAKRKNDFVVWTQASAEDLPFENESFGAALASLTIHHWKSIEKGFAEIYRVLKKGGNFVIFTDFPEQMETYWLNHYFPKMMRDATAAMPNRQKILAALDSSGFAVVKEEKYFVQPDLKDLFLYSGKHRPSLYFDAQVRKGISSFVAQSNEEEVNIGLQTLVDDLENGNFNQIAKSYQSDLGDYILIVGTKL